MKSRILLTNALLALLSLSIGAAGAATPSPAKSEHDKGVEAAAKKSYEEAVTHFTKAIELDSKDVAPYLERAVSNMHLKQFRKAIDDCKVVVATDKAHKAEQREANMIAAGAANMLGEWAEAADYSSKAIAIAPGALVYADRAMAYKGQNKLPEALQDIDQAIKLNGKRGGFYQLRAGIYEAMAKADRAKAAELAKK